MLSQEEKGDVGGQVLRQQVPQKLGVAVMALVLISLTRARVIWEDGTSAETMSPSDLPVGASS